jgi:hypothetical protein
VDARHKGMTTFEMVPYSIGFFSGQTLGKIYYAIQPSKVRLAGRMTMNVGSTRLAALFVGMFPEVS